MPFFGPSFGTVARRLNKKNIRVVGLIDNAIPHEKRIGDKRLTKYFFNYCDKFITLSSLVTKDIYELKKDAVVTTLFHPVYDVFGKKVRREDGLKFLELKEGKYLLFFGLIRDYKGLDLALEAMSHPEIKELNIKLIVAGEFYGNKKKYFDLIDELQLDNILLFPEFVPSEEVANYFAVADASFTTLSNGYSKWNYTDSL
jgi:Glycosyltransferase